LNLRESSPHFFEYTSYDIATSFPLHIFDGMAPRAIPLKCMVEGNRQNGSGKSLKQGGESKKYQN